MEVRREESEQSKRSILGLCQEKLRCSVVTGPCAKLRQKLPSAGWVANYRVHYDIAKQHHEELLCLASGSRHLEG